MTNSDKVAEHYAHGSLVDAIKQALSDLGTTPQSATVDDLAPVDEFHIGGRSASADFLDQLKLSPDHHVLDVGCGLGGPVRFAANQYGCRLTGIDLTDEFVKTGRVLND